MAVRRNARLRREYLYRKSLEGKEKELYERKERLKKAIEGEIDSKTPVLLLCRKVASFYLLPSPFCCAVFDCRGETHSR